MSWEVHDTLLKSLWLDLENQMGLQGKRPFLSHCTQNIFWALEQIFMKRESCFCLQSRFWLWCTAGKPLCTADLKFWNNHDVTFFYCSATTAQRRTISPVMSSLNSPLCGLQVQPKQSWQGALQPLNCSRCCRVQWDWGDQVRRH